MPQNKSIWLMKSEPDVFSIDDLKNCPNSTDSWDGVRNYQARNFMRDDMKKGDIVLFYHSNAKDKGIVGLATVCKESYPDHTALDPKSKYYDPKSSEDNPRWFMVDVKYKKKFKRVVTLEEIKSHPVLKKMLVAQKGQRLSIQPVKQNELDALLELV